MLKRFADLCYRRRRVVLLLWVVVLVGVSTLGRTAGGAYSQSFHLPHTDSQQATDLLQQRFPARSGATGDLVFRADAGVRDPAVRSRVEALVARVREVAHVRGVVSPSDAAGARQISRDGHVAFAQIQFDRTDPELPAAVGDRIAALAHEARAPGLQVELSGNMFTVRRPPGGTEAVGLLAAVVILLLAFGSVLAMGLPILTALFGIGIGLAGVDLLANVMSVPEFTSQLAAMIGIGVGIDYALFIVTRYRQGLGAGLDPEAAVVESIATSGKAVLFAGTTVVISLAGMYLMGIDFVRGLATGALLAVAVTMIASVTLLPAVLGFVGRNIDRLRLPWVRGGAEHRRGFWYRWSRIVQRHPWPAAGAGLLILVLLAWPVFSIQLGNSDAGNRPTTDTTRRAYDLLAEGFGPGFNGPLLLAFDVPSASAEAALPRVRAALVATPGVAQVSPPEPNPAHDAAVMQVFPTTSPQDHRTVVLIHHLRSDVLPAATAGSGLEAHVGGITAAFDDVATVLQRRLPLFIGAVLALSFVLLLVVFRSIAVPIKAVVVNLLSIGAAYGVLVSVFQHGHLSGVFGVGKGPVESFLPMMLFAILFGLSMDYEVFLLSRIKEEYDRSGDNSTAVADGLSHTAHVITAAALIMVTVFGSFVFGDNRVVKEFGLGLAVAILVDATVVRMLLVPAAMELLGDANWWFPGWLARHLPDIHIEGSPDVVEPPAEPVGATSD